MKLRLILEDRAWEYSLRVRQQVPGKYYVELCSLNGARLAPAVFTGSFRSLDLIIDAAPALYLQLDAMRQSADRPITAAMLELPLAKIEIIQLS